LALNASSRIKMKVYNPVIPEGWGAVVLIMGLIALVASIRTISLPRTHFRLFCGPTGVLASLGFMTGGLFRLAHVLGKGTVVNTNASDPGDADPLWGLAYRVGQDVTSPE
jgi:hypothetical protein